MNPMAKFICEQNVGRFRDSLETEKDAGRRSTLIQLLVAEEAKLGSNVEQLASVDRHIARCRELIARQRTLLAEMRGNGHDPRHGEALLETLRHSLAVHEEYRANICHSIDLIST